MCAACSVRAGHNYCSECGSDLHAEARGSAARAGKPVSKAAGAGRAHSPVPGQHRVINPVPGARERVLLAELHAETDPARREVIWGQIYPAG
jgi:hypothetical protein